METEEITIMVTERQRAMLERAARLRGLPLEEFVLAAVLERAAEVTGEQEAHFR
ncbi:DUF1778 domain-containing protein [Salmonella enterica]|nr:DUF1778 domain-containing protein [Salmonella enterica]